MGKSGSCNNLKTACSFLMKLATWIYSRVEITHILLLCLPNINFGCYGNLHCHCFIMGKCGSYNNIKNTYFFLMKLATWIESKVKNMHIVLICLPNINYSCYGKLNYHWLIMRECESYSNLKTAWTLFPLHDEDHIIPRTCSLDLAHLSRGGGVKESSGACSTPFNSLKA